jgi:dinuclear metal center YbgI/SA1388 family protein
MKGRSIPQAVGFATVRESMAHLNEMLAELDRLLEPDGFEDYGPNGLQVAGRDEVTHIATGVSASRELIERSIEAGAQLIVVHHGLFWRGDDPRVIGVLRERLALLLGADVSLAAYHLPLDAHPTYGNAARIAAGLGLEDSQPFGLHEGREVGVRARVRGEGIAPADLVARLGELTSREPLAFLEGPASIRSVGIVTGGGGRSMYEAIAAGIVACFPGERVVWARAIARESGIHFLAGGHHATETFGVAALGEHLATRFGVEHSDIAVNNPV